MAERVYLCKCSQDITLDGQELTDHLCKNPETISPYSIVSCFGGPIKREDILLSPTLMANLQHATVLPEVFKQLIAAEKLRYQEPATPFRTIKIKPEVVLISRNSTVVEEFIETYGGVIEIKPILLKKASSAEYITGEVVSIEGSFNNYKITVQSPHPVDFESCTYCGLCAKYCKEGCIDRALSFDLNLCSYCGICEKRCPENAIDIHRYNLISIEVPQIIIDDIKLELPEDRRGIFSITDYRGVFRNIGEYAVSETLSFNPSICQYHSGFDSGCKLCINLCKAGAIRKNEKTGLKIDHFLCNNCGTCVSVCPTGAMQYSPFNDRMFFEYFKGIDLSGLKIVFADEDTLKDFHWKNIGNRFDGVLFVEHSNPGAINGAQFLYLISKGVQRIFVSTGSGELSEEAGFINRLFEEISGVQSVIMPFDQRFIAAEVPSCKETSGQATHLLEGLNMRRAVFSALLKDILATYQKGQLSVNDSLGRFSDIQCDKDRCSLCLACVNVCLIGAMKANQEDFSLRFNPLACINCGLCVELCPEKVLKALFPITVSDGFFQDRLIAQDEPLRCQRCGKVFGNMKVFDEVRRRLIEAGLFQEKGRFLHLCEDCRVVAMFEDTLQEG